MRRRSTIGALVALSLAAPATAQAVTVDEKYDSRYDRVETVLKVDPGRHVVDDGLAKSDRRDADVVVRESAQRMLRWLRAARAPEPVVAAPVTPQLSAPEVGSSAVAPTAVASSPAPAPSGGGGDCGAGYRGTYQFDCQTWRSVGGTGDPAAASPEEQRARAERLRAERGNQPWPVCGRGGASLDQIAQCESGNDPTAVSG